MSAGKKCRCHQAACDAELIKELKAKVAALENELTMRRVGSTALRSQFNDEKQSKENAHTLLAEIRDVIFASMNTFRDTSKVERIKRYMEDYGWDGAYARPVLEKECKCLCDVTENTSIGTVIDLHQKNIDNSNSIINKLKSLL